MRIRVPLQDQTVTLDVAEQPPLGWRFWTFAGFPGDPVEPRPYGGSRALLLAPVESGPSLRWLAAMELDESFQLWAPHDLFPCARQEGADDFAVSILSRHAVEPRLL